MKKLIAVFMGGVLMASCSGKKSEQADSDSAATEADILEAVAAVRRSVYITADSIGPVSVGMPVNMLPDSVPGLYGKKTLGDSPDAMAYVFSDGDGESFVVYDFGEGNVDVINLIGSQVKVNAPRGDFGLGSPFTEVLRLPGVTAEWSGYEDGGMWYWKWEGLWFAPSQEHLPLPLSQRLYHSGQAPTQADFDDTVTVGFIGTGLPF